MRVKVRGTEKELYVKLDQGWNQGDGGKELKKFLRDNKQTESDVQKQSQAIVQNQRTIQNEEEYNSTIKLFNQQSRRYKFEVDEYAKTKAKLKGIYDSNFSNVSKEDIRNNPVLKEEIASGIREAMSEKIVTRLAGRTGSAPDAKAIASLFDGYSIKGAGNEANTFENVVVPLLGKNGKKYVKNLRVLDEMLQRELAQATPGSVAAYKELTDPGIAWWKRMIIKPLTQLGRRVTAIERTAGTKAEKSLGLILQNEKLLDATIKAVENEATRRTYYKVLTAWALGTGRGDDISVLPFSDYWAEAGSDFTNYDKVNKQRKDVENRTKIDDKRQSTYMRLLETSDFFDRLAQAGIN